MSQPFAALALPIDDGDRSEAAKTLYDRDVYAWSREQARLIRAGRFDQLDIENLAEEIESVGGSARSELWNRLATLVEHLLKLEASKSVGPRRQWRLTVIRSRDGIEDVLRHNPSLRREVRGLLTEIHPKTVRFTANLLEDAGEHDAVEHVLTQEGGFTDEELFGDWFPEGPNGER